MKGKGGEEEGECDGRTALRGLERVGGERRTTVRDRRCCRLLIENVVKES